jgi:hypothetical protein
MQKDIEQAVELFCIAQNKQIEAAQKAAKMQEGGIQSSAEDISKELEEANSLMEQYGEKLNQIAEKYKGKERAYSKMMKERLKKCK